MSCYDEPSLLAFPLLMRGPGNRFVDEAFAGEPRPRAQSAPDSIRQESFTSDISFGNNAYNAGGGPGYTRLFGDSPALRPKFGDVLVPMASGTRMNDLLRDNPFVFVSYPLAIRAVHSLFPPLFQGIGKHLWVEDLMPSLIASFKNVFYNMAVKLFPGDELDWGRRLNLTNWHVLRHHGVSSLFRTLGIAA